MEHTHTIRYVGEAVERIDASSEANAKADELFDMIDADSSGSIEKYELQNYLLGGSSTAIAPTRNPAFGKGGRRLTSVGS